MTEGRPLFMSTPASRFTLANFTGVHLFNALGALKIGLGIFDREQVKIDRILGHGGFFKTPEVGQKVMAAAMNVPVSVMETAGETLEDYLESKVFAGGAGATIAPDAREVEGFNAFMERYKKSLVIERAAAEELR